MISTAILDDNKEYVIIKELVINGTEYTMFANPENETDICFRKTVVKDGKEYYVGLKDKSEFDLVIMNFTKDIIN